MFYLLPVELLAKALFDFICQIEELRANLSSEAS